VNLNDIRYIRPADVIGTERFDYVGRSIYDHRRAGRMSTPSP
jgi:hypothetical protein